MRHADLVLLLLLVDGNGRHGSVHDDPSSLHAFASLSSRCLRLCGGAMEVEQRQRAEGTESLQELLLRIDYVKERVKELVKALLSVSA